MTLISSASNPGPGPRQPGRSISLRLCLSVAVVVVSSTLSSSTPLNLISNLRYLYFHFPLYPLPWSLHYPLHHSLSHPPPRPIHSLISSITHSYQSLHYSSHAYSPTAHPAHTHPIHENDLPYPPTTHQSQSQILIDHRTCWLLRICDSTRLLLSSPGPLSTATVAPTPDTDTSTFTFHLPLLRCTAPLAARTTRHYTTFSSPPPPLTFFLPLSLSYLFSPRSIDHTFAHTTRPVVVCVVALRAVHFSLPAVFLSSSWSWSWSCYFFVW